MSAESERSITDAVEFRPKGKQKKISALVASGPLYEFLAKPIIIVMFDSKRGNHRLPTDTSP